MTKIYLSVFKAPFQKKCFCLGAGMFFVKNCDSFHLKITMHFKLQKVTKNIKYSKVKNISFPF